MIQINLCVFVPLMLFGVAVAAAAYVCVLLDAEKAIFHEIARLNKAKSSRYLPTVLQRISTATAATTPKKLKKKEK